MATTASAIEFRRETRTRVAAVQPLLVPLASLLVALTLLGAGARLLLVVALRFCDRRDRPPTSPAV